MSSGYTDNRMSVIARIMAGLSVVGAAAVVLLRVWILPAERDMDTGLFTTNLPVIALMLFLVAALGALVFIVRGGPRREITGKPSLAVSVVLLIVGGGMILYGGAETLARLGVIAWDAVSSVTEAETTLHTVLPWLQTAFCVLGGVALVMLGLRLASEGSTRRGMSQWSLLAPVLWMWFVLANYEMSYASMVRVTEGFFTLGMYIAELLFLYRFACYVAGIGRNGIGSLLFYSCSAALFGLSSPLVRVCMYLLQDGEAYAAAGAAGVTDLLVGVLALTVSVALCQCASAAPVSVEDEEDRSWPEPVEVIPEVELIEAPDSEDFSEE